MALDDYGALLRSAQAAVPDYAEQEARRQMMILQRRRLEAEAATAQREQREGEAFQADLDHVMTNPTAQSYAGLILRHPKYAEKVKGAWSMVDGARQQADLTQAGEIYTAAKNGRFDLASASLKRRIEADKAADGEADPQDEAMLAALESGDPVQQKAAIGMMGLHLATITGPDKFAATLGQLDTAEDDKDFTLSPGARRYSADGSLIAEAPFAPRPITVGEGQTVVEYQPGGGGPASGGTGGNGAPRGLRNANPGNLKDGPFAKAQPGYKGADADGFAIFGSIDQGKAAQTNLLRSKYLRNGVDTIDAIVERYAPPGENSPEARANYKQHVASQLGIGIGDKIGTDLAPKLADAMADFENGTGGTTGPRVIAKGDPKKVTPSETRVVNGQVFVKVAGQWYRKKS